MVFAPIIQPRVALLRRERAGRHSCSEPKPCYVRTQTIRAANQVSIFVVPMWYLHTSAQSSELHLNHHNPLKLLVAAAGLEPALRITEADFKSAVSTNSTTRPIGSVLSLWKPPNRKSGDHEFPMGLVVRVPWSPTGILPHPQASRSARYITSLPIP